MVVTPAGLSSPSAPETDGPRSLARWAWLSVCAALITLILKFTAWGLTGSVGLFSDAVESTVNLVAAFTVLFALWFSQRPVDESHHFGHAKIEYFAAAVEGGLVLVAAGGIIWFSVRRLLDPQPLEKIGIGLAVSVLAGLVNFVVARALLRVARNEESVVLEADGNHLMADVWTTVGVVFGIAVVAATGTDWIDPLIGIGIALIIVRTGLLLLRTSFDGLMDRSLERADEQEIRQSIESALVSGSTYHALRTRRAGATRFVDLHLLVPGEWNVAESHHLANQIERAVDDARPGTQTTVHIEPLEDPGSWRDSDLLDFEPVIEPRVQDSESSA